LSSLAAWSQDDSEETVTAEEREIEELQVEQNYLDFKDYFISAIQHHIQENYDLALSKLNQCEKIYPDNLGMLYHKAKNYKALKDYQNADFYCDKLLTIQPDNYWGKTLKRDLFTAQNNFVDALSIQEDLYNADLNEAQELLKLYLKTQNLEKGKKVLKAVDDNAIYVENINYFKKVFNVKKITQNDDDSIDNNPTPTLKNTTQSIDYESIRKSNDFDNLYKVSSKALFQEPTNYTHYLYNGIALNKLKKHKDAIQILESGLDFIFEENKSMLNFYKELEFAYAALKNDRKAKYYQEMVHKLQNRL
jgi:predicted Zn-dependent protease